MIKMNFLDGIQLLERNFEKKPNDDLRAYLWDNLNGFHDQDFNIAVDELRNDPIRKVFPRMGEIKAVIGKVRAARVDREWQEMKSKEKREVERIMATPRGDEIRASNKKRLKMMVQAISLGKEACDSLSEQFKREDKDLPLESNSCPCDDGLVYTMRLIGGSKYGSVGACMRCKSWPKWYPQVDPVTHQVLTEAKIPL